MPAPRRQNEALSIPGASLLLRADASLRGNGNGVCVYGGPLNPPFPLPSSTKSPSTLTKALFFTCCELDGVGNQAGVPEYPRVTPPTAWLRVGVGGDNSQPDTIPQDNREKSGSLKTNNLSKTLRVYKREGGSDKPGSSGQAHWGERGGSGAGVGWGQPTARVGRREQSG